MESDPHGKFGCAGGQGKENLEEIEYVKIACGGSFHGTLTKDVDVFAKASFLDSYTIICQADVPYACQERRNPTHQQYYRCKALWREAVRCH